MKLTVEKFKRSAKRLADLNSKPLNEAQEELAAALGLGNFNAALTSLRLSDEVAAKKQTPEDVKRPEPLLPEKWQGRPNLDLYLRLFEVAGHAFGRRNARVNMLLSLAYACLPSALQNNPVEVKSILNAGTSTAGIQIFLRAARTMLYWSNIVKLFQTLRDEGANDDKLKCLKAYVFSEQGLNADPLLESKFVDAFNTDDHTGHNLNRLPLGFRVKHQNYFVSANAQQDHDRILAILMNALEPAMQDLMRTLKPEFPLDNQLGELPIEVSHITGADDILQMFAALVPLPDDVADHWRRRAMTLACSVLRALVHLRDTSDLVLTPASFAEHMSLNKIESLYVEGHLLARENGGLWHPAFAGIKNYLESALPGFNFTRFMLKHGIDELRDPDVAMTNDRRMLRAPNSANDQPSYVVEKHMYVLMQWEPVLRSFGLTIEGLSANEKVA